MSNILSDILKYLSFDDVNIDNTMFKMYYKVYGKSDRKAHKISLSLRSQSKLQLKPNIPGMPISSGICYEFSTN